MLIRQQPKVHDTFASEELEAKVARRHSFTLRENELSEHGFSLRNHVRKDKSSGRVICSDRAKACHDRRLHIEKFL